MFKVNTIELDQFRKQIEMAEKSIRKEVSGELQAAAMEFERLAKLSVTQNKSGDRGTLRNSIGYREKDPMNFEVFAGTFYAPFIEFGTKSKAVVPAGLEDVANQFKGLAGTGALSLTDAIKGWVIRKKIATKEKADGVAFLIARSIYRNGITPKPFFYKHTATVRTNLFKRLNVILNGI